MNKFDLFNEDGNFNEQSYYIKFIKLRTIVNNVIKQLNDCIIQNNVLLDISTNETYNSILTMENDLYKDIINNLKEGDSNDQKNYN